MTKSFSSFLPALSLILLTSLAGCASSNRDTRSDTRSDTLQSALVPGRSVQLGNQLQQAQVDPNLFLNRLTWGENASSMAAMQSLGMDKYLYQQLLAKRAQLPEAIQKQIDAMTISQKPFATLMQELDQQRRDAAEMKGTDDTLRKAYQQELTRVAREAASRSVLRATYSSNQLLEQMDWFWMNHFNISNRKDNLRAMVGDFEENAIRPQALGNFRSLLRATLFHPAMLRYLDNEHNAVNKINENYARELMELHTMGVGSGYTQTDVQELARVLTGVGINLRPSQTPAKVEQQPNFVRLGMMEFNPRRHDFGDKTILGVTIKGRGIAEVEQVIDLLSRQPATAKFISRKLAMYFVSDEPSQALVDSMAATFLRSDGDIPSVLQTMFYAPEFTASLGKKFKDPVHYVIASVRLAYDGSHIVNTGPILNWINTLGQQANGHQTPDGYPLYEMAWSSAAQMTARFDVARAIARGTPNLFKPEDDDGKNEALNAQARELARPALAQNAYVKTMSKRFSPSSQEALTQSASPQEWNAFFLATPEMMRR